MRTRSWLALVVVVGTGCGNASSESAANEAPAPTHAPAPTPPEAGLLLERCAESEIPPWTDTPVAVPEGLPGDFGEAASSGTMTAVSSSGNAVVAWDTADAIRVRRYDSGQWRTADTATYGGAPRARGLAVSPGGRLALAYYDFVAPGHPICLRQQLPNGTWSPAWLMGRVAPGFFMDWTPPPVQMGYVGEELVAGFASDASGSAVLVHSSDGITIAPPVVLGAHGGPIALAVRSERAAYAAWFDVATDRFGALGFDRDAGWSDAASPDLSPVLLQLRATGHGGLLAAGLRVSESEWRLQTSSTGPGAWSEPEDVVSGEPDHAPTALSATSDRAGRVMLFVRSESLPPADCESTTYDAIWRANDGPWKPVPPPADLPNSIIVDGALADSGHAVVLVRQLDACEWQASYLRWFVADTGWLAPDLQDSAISNLAFAPDGRLLVTWQTGSHAFRVGWLNPP